MALRRVFLCAPPHTTPRLTSTAPAAREQPTLGPRAVPACGTADAARPRVPVVDFGNAQEAYAAGRAGSWRATCWCCVCARRGRAGVPRAGAHVGSFVLNLLEGNFMNSFGA
uniref:Uncharacterized protein n=1 Tax=Castor canadensis TaxID=51338 RepID=A0A8C0XDT6_CASCN